MRDPPSVSRTIGEEALLKLRDAGHASEVLDARLQYAEANQVLTHYLTPLSTVARVYPTMLPTQRSGRWSTTDPNLPGMSARCINPDHEARPEHAAERAPCWSLRDCVVPDIGTKWVGFDWEAIEAKIVSAYCKDEEDLEAFRNRWDIHSITARKMYGWPRIPFEPTKANVFGEVGAVWRSGLGVEYTEACRPRRLAKNARYALGYGESERAMDRYAAEMGMSVGAMREAGHRYLNSKPLLVSWKSRTWADCWRTHESRTILGRRRRLFGKQKDVQKQGLNHKVQGSVADMMNTILRAVDEYQPNATLVYQTHDGAKWRFPRDADPLPWLQPIVEREWDVDGTPITSTAEWKEWYAPEETTERVMPQ